jgi:hypothetical protein
VFACPGVDGTRHYYVIRPDGHIEYRDSGDDPAEFGYVAR